jgi:hypothetical protein
MIVIENADLIEGDATTAAEVDFQIYGLDNNALANLADGQLANSKGTLYTANSTDVVTTIVLVNTGAAHNHVNLYHKPSAGTSRRLIPKDFQLEPGYSLHWEGGKLMVVSTAGEVVFVDNITPFLDDTAGGTDALTTKAPTSNAFYDHTQKTDTHGATGAIVGTTNEQTLTLKTLTTPVVATLYQDAGKTKLMTIPNTASDTLCAIAATQELDNKTLDSSVGKGTWTASGTWTLPAVTLGGDVQLGEVSILLDAAISADGKWSGIAEAGTAGAILAFGDLVYLQTADSKWELANADNAATGCSFKLGICVLAANENAATVILLWGKVNAATAFPALTIGAPVYMGIVAGDVQVAAPSATTDVVRVVGYGNTADELFFNPSQDWFEKV